MAFKKKKPSPESPSSASRRYLQPGTIAPGWVIVSPIVIEVEKDEDDEFIVTDQFSTVYGNGKSEAAAIDDYRTSLVDYFEILENQSRKNRPSELVFHNLLAYINRVKT